MTNISQKSPVLFLDFDGTISRRDAIDALLEAFADPRWLAIEEQWKAGRIGSRQCLRAQMSLIRAAPRKVNALLDSIELDQGFGALLETCAGGCVPVHIVSDGFDYCIRRILSNASQQVARLISGVPIFSSRLRPSGERWQVEFPYFAESCAHGCATCKPTVMRQLGGSQSFNIFVGDGLSDRYAALSADLVFAKKGLAEFCREQSIAYVPYESLCEVAAYLDAWQGVEADLKAEEAA